MLKWFLLKYLTKYKDKLIKDEECTKDKELVKEKRIEDRINPYFLEREKRVIKHFNLNSGMKLENRMLPNMTMLVSVKGSVQNVTKT